jgi:uncharacterized protein YhfF
LATGTFKWYLNAIKNMAEADVDLVAAGVKVQHTSASETPDQDADEFESAWDANKVSGTNLPADGVALDTPTLTVTGGTNVIKWDATDYSVATVTASGIKNSHFVDTTGANEATNPGIGYIVWDTAMSPSAGTLSIVYDAAGIATITPAA